MYSTYPNQNPWITGKKCTELKARAATFKEQDTYPDASKKSCYNLRQAIKQAKSQYRTKRESDHAGADPQGMWQGLQTITVYKGKPSHGLPSDMSLPDELHASYMLSSRQATLNHA